jgi:hypothetical protein
MTQVSSEIRKNQELKSGLAIGHANRVTSFAWATGSNVLPRGRIMGTQQAMNRSRA